MENTTALILPSTAPHNLVLTTGHALIPGATPDRRIALPSQRKYTLAEMIARCDLSAPPPADMAEWDNMKPEGGEVW